jgi:hypothetical protein
MMDKCPSKISRGEYLFCELPKDHLGKCAGQIELADGLIRVEWFFILYTEKVEPEIKKESE